MKKMMLIPAAGFFCLIAASPQVKPIPASVAFRLEEKDLIPEGITHDSRTGRFFLSSINKEKVVAVDAAGKASDFIASGRDGVMESLGLKADGKNRRLWVLSNKDVGDRHLSAVHVFHLDTRALVKKFILDKKEHQLFNDLVLTRDGSAYITDTEAHRLYFVPHDLDRLELFLESAELLNSANGIAVSPDDKVLYVGALKHITLVDLKTKSMRPIGNPASVEDSGIDGLLFHRGGLVAVVNGVATVKDIHIARYVLSPDGREIRSRSIIDRGNPLFNIPTTAVIAGDDLFCLADTCLDVYLEKKMNEKGKLQRPTVLKYDLSDKRAAGPDQRISPAVFGCTIVMAARNGLVLAGNNEDRNHLKTIATFIPAKDKFYGRIIFGYDDAPVQGGMNDQGLFVDANALAPTGWEADPDKPMIPMNVMMNILASCATCEDVKALFEKFNVPGLARARFPVADRTGASMVVEYGRGRVQFVKSDSWYQIATNFVMSNVEKGEYPCWRYRTADRILSGAGELSVELIRDVLEQTHQEGRALTVYSNICDLKKGTIHLYNLRNFKEVVVLNLAEELKKGQRTLELSSLFKKAGD